MVATGADVVQVNTSDPGQIEKLARSMTPEELLGALETIGLARQRLIANGSALLVLEAMMVGLTLPRGS